MRPLVKRRADSTQRENPSRLSPLCVLRYMRKRARYIRTPDLLSNYPTTYGAVAERVENVKCPH